MAATSRARASLDATSDGLLTSSLAPSKNGVITFSMVKRLQLIGNSSGLIIDKPILELLRITAQTDLELSTDGERLIITPIRNEAARRRKIASAQSRTLAKHEATFRKLAK
jgi:antitoxin MazE